MTDNCWDVFGDSHIHLFAIAINSKADKGTTAWCKYYIDPTAKV